MYPQRNKFEMAAHDLEVTYKTRQKSLKELLEDLHKPFCGYFDEQERK